MFLLSSIVENTSCSQILEAIDVSPLAYAISFTLNYKLGTAMKLLIAVIMLVPSPLHIVLDKHSIFEHDDGCEAGHD
jgi:hypothetical protein